MTVNNPIEPKQPNSKKEAFDKLDTKSQEEVNDLIKKALKKSEPIKQKDISKQKEGESR
jgi:hypothetical protein